MTGIIEMVNVSFAVKNRLVVQDFSCRFEEGKTTALLGPSGCGKSTVLKLAAGILVPNEGLVTYRGKDIFNMTRQENLDFRRESSMVFQDSALWANQSLYQNLELPLIIHFPEMSPADRGKRIKEVLGKVGYKRNLSIRPAQLSMGEQKLIAFARAIICRPNLLFLDEWLESLDDSAGQRLIHLVQLHQKENNTVILICHNFRIARYLADFIVMIKEGRHYLNISREQIDNDESLAQYIEKGLQDEI